MSSFFLERKGGHVNSKWKKNGRVSSVEDPVAHFLCDGESFFCDERVS